MAYWMRWLGGTLVMAWASVPVVWSVSGATPSTATWPTPHRTAST